MAKKRFFQESELVFKEKPENAKFQDLSGSKFGRLNVIGYAGRENKRTLWFCKCECGNIIKLQAGNIKSGVTTSCGCFQKEGISKRNTIHGHSIRGEETLTFSTWSSMMKRCYGKNPIHFNSYLNRGITVCKRWHEFKNFLADMGERPKGKTLDRKDNDKGYCKENCRWATRKEQQNNRRSNRVITFNEKTQTLTQWADELGVSYRVIQERLKRDWPLKLALTLPSNRNRRIFTKHSKHD